MDAEGAGTRLDVWLQGRFPGRSRSSLRRLVEQGRIQLLDRPAKPSTQLRAGDRIRAEFPPPPPSRPLPEEIPLDVLHEDGDLIVLHKPAGMVVHPGAGNRSGGTLVNALLAHSAELSREAGHHRPGIIHRLDQETSGVLVVARHDEAHRRIADQFREREVEKEYLALVHGRTRETAGEIDRPIGRSFSDRKRMAIRHDEEAREAFTAWRRVGLIDGFSWILCRPRTGRTHQIRVHLRSIGHPIVCDRTYGRESSITRSELLGGRADAEEPPLLERQALHALRLSFRHPGDGRPVSFEAPLPPDLTRIWELSEIEDAPEQGPPDRGSPRNGPS